MLVTIEEDVKEPSLNQRLPLRFCFIVHAATFFPYAGGILTDTKIARASSPEHLTPYTSVFIK